MPICGSLHKYGVINFELLILELVPDTFQVNISEREHYWVSVIKPSYNQASIIDSFVGKNHPRYGKTVSAEVRNKISATLTGRKLSSEHVKNTPVPFP